MNSWPVPLGNQPVQAPEGTAFQTQDRRPARQCANLDVAKRHALGQSRSQCLGARLLGGPALRQNAGAVGHPPGQLQLGFRVHPFAEPVAVPGKHSFDPGNVDDVVADAEYQAEGPFVGQDGSACRSGPGFVHETAHADNGRFQPQEYRFTDQEVTDVQFDDFGNRRYRRDGVVGEAVPCMNLKTQ